MLKPLTPEQSDFATAHHNLIYRFLHKKGYPADEYYDVAVFGFLKAVQKYHEREDLRVYAFSTIAFTAMRREMSDHFREQRRLKRFAEIVPYDDKTDVANTVDSTWAAVESKLIVEAVEKYLTAKSNVIQLQTELLAA